MHGAAAAQPEPSSKLLEQYAEGGELHEAKDMGWVVLREHCATAHEYFSIHRTASRTLRA